jgi:hypothetical protein
MWRSVVGVASLLLVACGSERTAEAPVADTRAAEEATVRVPEGERQEGFAVMLGNDTVLVERYSRAGRSLVGELLERQSGARLTYRASVGPEERITRMEIAAFEPGADLPQEQGVAEFRGDTLVAETREDGAEPRVERQPLPAGTLMHLGSSVALLEQVIRRAGFVGGDEVELPMLLLAGGDDGEGVERIRVTRVGADSVHIFRDERNQIRAEVDADGRILGAVNPPQNVRVVRLP